MIGTPLIAALALAAGTPAAQAEPDPSAEIGTPVAFLREVCLHTGLRRDAFKRLFADDGRRSGWDQAIRVVYAGERIDPVEWSDGYGSNKAAATASVEGRLDDGFPGLALSCEVNVPATGDWRAEVEALAQEMGMTPAPEPRRARGVSETRAWVRQGPSPTSLQYELSRSRVTLRVERQPIPRAQ